MRARTIAAAAALVLAVGAAMAAPVAVGLAGTQELPEMTMEVVVPQETLTEGDEPFAVEVWARGAENIASFEFQMIFDPTILAFVREERGDFLGSTGREVQCNAVTDGVSSGVFRYFCVTLREAPKGPSGDGLLARVIFDPIGSGTTAITLERELANIVPDEDPGNAPLPQLPIRVVNGVITVESRGGFNWLLWAPIIGVGGLAVAGGAAFAAVRLRNGRAARETPATATQ